MRKSLIVISVLIVAILLLSGYKKLSVDSLKLNKSEPPSFLGENANVSGDQSAALTEYKDFNSDSSVAVESGISAVDVESIRAALAASFSMKTSKIGITAKKETSEIEITVERESEENFVTGFVNIGEGDKGGIYFAARTDEGWKIAHNGTGVVKCAPANSYGFPVGLIPRCFDQETGMNIDR